MECAWASAAACAAADAKRTIVLPEMSSAIKESIRGIIKEKKRREEDDRIA